MILSWQIEEAGPAARSVPITVAPSCVSDPSGSQVSPTAVVHQTRSAIHIWVFERRPEHGHFCRAAGDHWSLAVRLPAPIEGRRIEGQSWPSPLHYGSLRGTLLGLPRLLGLAPAQALRVLWLEGFHARLTGRGRQVVAQLPGWGLVDPPWGRKGDWHPDPYDGVTRLRAGRNISIAMTPVLRAGAHSGVLLVAPPSGRAVALFDAHGRLLARFRMPRRHPARLRLAPARYLLLADYEVWISCGPTAARVRAGQTTNVTVTAGCDVP